MRNKFLFFLLLLSFFLLNTQRAIAETFLDNGCRQSPQFFLAGTSRAIDPAGGVTVTVTTSVEQGKQKNVVVVGQDPEEEGVGITVTLASIEGDIVHNE